MLVSDASFNGIINDLQGAENYEVVTLQVARDCESKPDRDKVSFVTW